MLSRSTPWCTSPLVVFCSPLPCLRRSDVRVPLLVSGPGIVPGTVLPQLVGNIDITPTIMELVAGPAAIPPVVDGKSFVP
jgi:arylsulfatase A-like enzyme